MGDKGKVGVVVGFVEDSYDGDEVDYSINFYVVIFRWVDFVNDN